MSRKAVTALIAAPSVFADEACNVIVIGSGISGLATAQSLARLNCSSVVLEARDEIGGRTHTVTTGPFTGVELGAHWVHGGLDNKVSMPLLNYLGIPVVPVGGDDDFEGKRGKFDIFDGQRMLTKTEKRSAFKLFRHIMGKADDYLDASMDETCDGSAECRAQDISENDAWDHALASFQPPLSADDLRRVDLLKMMMFEQDYGNKMSEVGGRIGELADCQDFYPDEGEGDAFVEGGYVSLVRALAVGLDIRVSSPVTQIKYEEDGVSVVANGEIFRGTHAVVTAHANVLPKIEFLPHLPSWKTDALGRIGAGPVGKLLVLLKDAIPDEYAKGYAFGRLFNNKTDLITMCIHSASEHPRHSNFNFHRTLECFIGAEAVKAADDMEPEMRRATAEKQLQEIFGDSVAVEATQLTPWVTDPYIGLAWSYPTVGSVKQDFLDYAKSVGRVHFAGEGSCFLMWGNVHAALATAGRVVHELVPEHLRALLKEDDWPLFHTDIANACEMEIDGMTLQRRNRRWSAGKAVLV